MSWVALRGLFGVGSSLLIQQGLNAIAGILIVRSLTRGDYATYSVALTSLGGITVLAEAGVVASILSIGGRMRLADERALLYSYARRFRWASLALAIAVFAPAAVVLLIGTETEWPEWLVVLILVAATAGAMSTSAMYGSVARLENRFSLVNTVMAASAGLRLVAIAAIALWAGQAASPAAFLAVTGVFSIVESIFLQRRLPRVRSAPSPSVWAHDFRRNSLRQLPSSAYYVAQGIVLPTILVSIGNSLAIADIAALSRYALLFTVVALTLTQFLAPRLARASLHNALRIYTLTLFAFISCAAVLMVAILLLNDELLLILGVNYVDLGAELLVVSLGAALSALASTLVALNQARAWLRLAWLQIPMSIVWLILLILLISPSTIESAAWFYALTPVPAVASLALCAFFGFRDENFKAGS